MENEEISFDDFNTELLFKSHIGLERQGIGSPESTIKALSCIDIVSNDARIADFGCGTGGQTIVLAQNTKGTITGLDLFPSFIKKLNANAEKLGLQNRVKGIVGSMVDLPFQNDEFDVIWSEGAIDSIGFEKGLYYWNGFLKKNGYIAVTSATWFTDERPAEIEKFWADAVPGMGTIAKNIATMQKAGYIFVAAFTLPEKCWTDNYFIPRQAAGKALLEKYPGNKEAEDYFANDKYEFDSYLKYKQYYGYVFYVGKKAA